MIEYHFLPEKKMSVAVSDGETVAKCTYKDHGFFWEITHTYVNPDYRGKGIASRIVDIIIDEARKAGVKIKPTCSYAARYMGNKAEFADILALE